MQSVVSHHGGKQRRFADAIAADYGKRFTCLELKVDVLNDDGLAIAARYVVKL